MKASAGGRLRGPNLVKILSELGGVGCTKSLNIRPTVSESKIARAGRERRVMAQEWHNQNATNCPIRSYALRKGIRN